jgi:formylglycine-generating enzyme required for sulfatase activity
MSPDDLPTTSGRYEDLGVIGVGAMGEVRRVRDRLLGRVMAMKIIRPELARHGSALARFIEEAQVAAQLQHPGIVPVHDIGRLSDGRVFFTMQEIRGLTLKAHIGRRVLGQEDALSLRRIIAALHEACQTVGYAHSRGVLHRDLKPDNIMLGDFGEVLVVDWGLARVLGQEGRTSEVVTTRSAASAATIPGHIHGTPTYMSPEQAAGQRERVSARSDVYALGCILYEILSGRPPYPGVDVTTILDAVRAGPPASLPLSTPAELASICWIAIARQPADRYADGHAMATALSAWLEGLLGQEKARSVVRRAHALAPRAARLRRRAGLLRREARQHLDAAPAWAEEEEKAEGWEWEDMADELELEATLAEQQAEQLLYAAFTHDPLHSEAHAALAESYRQQHVAAEAAGQRIEARRLALLLEGHLTALDPEDPQRIRGESYLIGDGTLTLRTDPADAEVRLYRYEQQRRRSRPVLARVLGHTPLVEVPLEMGSYLLELRASSRATVRYPVRVLRQGRCAGVPPGAALPMSIPLPAPGEVGSGEVYVPAGWFTTGSDPAVQPEAREVWLDGFIIHRHPITNRQYLRFLNDLRESGQESRAVACAPQESGRLLYARQPDGRFMLAEGGSLGQDCPVVLIDWSAARAYADWLSAQTGQRWRLPLSLEWEKAARGVDGRHFPWGSFLDPSWCCIRDSHQGTPGIVPIHRFPADISPYGVRGMGGNVRDWCLDAWREQGPRTEEGRAVLSEGIGAAMINVRGGSWYSQPEQARAARALRLAPGARSSDVGFRLVREYPA